MADQSRRLQIGVTVFVALSAALLIFKTEYTLANLNSLVHLGPGHSAGIWDYYRQGTIQLLWFGLAVNAVILVGTWVIWRWFSFLVMALGFVSVLGIIINLVTLFDGGQTGLILPPELNVLAVLQSAAFVALAVWVLLVRTRRLPALAPPPPAEAPQVTPAP